jgi:hypothetical protein
VHVWRASGNTLPISPDSDGDLLPDSLEVGWRVASTPPTLAGVDSNLDGIPNFVGDVDPPLYAVVAHSGFVPGVGSQSQGDDRTRQAAGSVTDPTKADSDDDGISDGIEDKNRNGWIDGDGKSLPLTAAREAFATHRPNTGDWPNNKIDSFETWTETSPTKADSDEDGLSDGFGEDKDFDGVVDGDTDGDRAYDTGEAWTETNPLDSDTDGDGLPDGWEAQYGLDPLDNGTDSFRTAAANDGNANNGAAGDPDGDGFTNAQELASGTHPTQPTTGGGNGGEGSITIGTFTQWRHTDLLVLDEYNEGNSSGGADVYRSGNDSDNSRDILAFSFRDGGDANAGGDGRVYFRVDFMDLGENAWQGEVDAYVVIDTGNPGAGERSMPNEVDIATDMKWEAVVAVYGQNFGSIFVDRNAAQNTTTQFQNPVTEGGVEARGFGGLNEAAWSSRYDAVEIAVERRHLTDAGWLGGPNTLNFQVFVTKPNTTGSGTGDITGRNDIRDTIYDDYLASDWWRDQSNITLNGKLAGYFGRSSGNDRNKNAKVVFVAHGNQAIQPASVTQPLIHSVAGTNSPTGYSRLIKSHEDHGVPLTLHVTPTLASALQWAANPAPGAANDGPALNQRIKNLATNGKIDLVGSTFADHVPKYFQHSFNLANKQLSDEVLTGIYGAGSVSSNIFWAPERVLDDESLTAIYNLGYRYVFADQMRHFLKWFGRSAALGTTGYRINEVNGMKIIPIHDEASAYLDQIRDEGSALAVRQLLSRRARSGVQDQAVVLWRDMGDFASSAKSDSYEANVRWLGTRPWIRVVTAQQIADNQVDYVGQNGNIFSTWGTENRGTGQNLRQTAKDWVDWATRENYDNWFNNLKAQSFTASSAFGEVGVGGHANEAWSAVNSVSSSSLQKVARAAIGGAMFQTAFHFPSATTDLRKFSTGDYINPANNNETLADFAKNTQGQTRFAKVYERVQVWASTANANTLGKAEQDIDLDGAFEYLLYNSRIFAVFEAKGGRMTAAWLRDPETAKIWQVAGNFASYANTDTEDEGTSNVTVGTNGVTSVNAFRTSGFKDWWAVTGGTGSSSAINANYSASSAGAAAWTFTQGGISKTISLPDTWSGNIRAAYALSGPSQLFVRFGLSPNLFDLMKSGHANLSTSVDGNTRFNLLNSSSDGLVRAFVQTSAGSLINTNATDKAVSFSTGNMRNQAQTHQVEVQITNNTIVTLGFDQGTDFTQPTDSDGDGMDDSWETANFGNLNRDGTGDADGDGLTDLQEFVLGSDPKNAASGRPVTVKDTNGFHVTFPTATGRTYTVLCRDNLEAGDWTTVANIPNGQSNPVQGTGAEITLTDTSATSGVARRFYRVQVSKP